MQENVKLYSQEKLALWLYSDSYSKTSATTKDGKPIMMFADLNASLRQYNHKRWENIIYYMYRGKQSFAWDRRGRQPTLYCGMNMIQSKVGETKVLKSFMSASTDRAVAEKKKADAEKKSGAGKGVRLILQKLKYGLGGRLVLYYFAFVFHLPSR